jgi:hypothetical protein
MRDAQPAGARCVLSTRAHRNRNLMRTLGRMIRSLAAVASSSMRMTRLGRMLRRYLGAAHPPRKRAGPLFCTVDPPPAAPTADFSRMIRPRTVPRPSSGRSIRLRGVAGGTLGRLIRLRELWIALFCAVDPPSMASERPFRAVDPSPRTPSMVLDAGALTAGKLAISVAPWGASSGGLAPFHMGRVR